MNKIKDFFLDIANSLLYMAFAIIVGLVLGVLGAYFSIAIGKVTELREAHTWILYFLPLGALIIVFLYHLTKGDKTGGTNKVLLSAETGEPIPLYMAPQIYASTIFSHLIGASVGREGAALQLGGSVGYSFGRLFRLKGVDRGIMVMVGMSAAFSALLGTPLTAAIFAIELSSVGIMHYSAFLPCVISAMTASITAKEIGAAPLNFGAIPVPEFSYMFLGKVVVVGIVCGFIALLFCTMMELVEKYSEKFIPNMYIRAVAGGSLLLGMSFLFGLQTYNGAGSALIVDAIQHGKAPEFSFVLKILFTAVSIAAGYKGGEIVPSFVIGATSGCLLGHVLGIELGFAAAMGLGAVFCGATNCPIAAAVFCFELFDFRGAPYFLIVTALSFVFSKSKSLYSAQKIYEK